jgi:hypothetical protein
VRDSAFRPEMLSELTAFAKNGRMYQADFARAASSFANNPTGEGSKLRGTFVLNIEYSSLLQVFGRVDEKGNKYMTPADLKSLFIDNKDPEGWSPPPALSVTRGTLFGGAIKMGFIRLWNRVKGWFGF